jgi:hypothetical protein
VQPEAGREMKCGGGGERGDGQTWCTNRYRSVTLTQNSLNWHYYCTKAFSCFYLGDNTATSEV